MSCTHSCYMIMRSCGSVVLLSQAEGFGSLVFQWEARNVHLFFFFFFFFFSGRPKPAMDEGLPIALWLGKSPRTLNKLDAQA